MSKSSIEWTDGTWNPTTGCTKVSQGCKYCYAEKETNRYMHMPKNTKYKKGFDVFVQHESALKEPYGWKKPTTVFVNSMSDLFHEDMALEFLQKVFKVMNETPEHTYQILTKRGKRLEELSDQLDWSDNIWMGVSVENKETENRIESLVKSGAKHRFLSVEPLLEELSDLKLDGIEWVIVGGESGSKKARPIEKDWVLKIKKNCDEQNVLFFFKQWGKNRNNPSADDVTMDKEHSFYAKGGCMIDGEIYLANPTIKDYTPEKLKLFKEEYLVVDEYEELETIWELKSYLPTMKKPLFKQLKEDINKNNLNDPILFVTTSENKKLVIDGHTRLKACKELKMKGLLTKEVKEDFESLEEIKLWMVKHQCQKRNLSKIERIQLAFLSKPTIEKIAKENLSKAGKKEKITAAIDTNQQIAILADVSRTTVVRYNSVLESGDKSVLRRVNKGELSISKANTIIKSKAKTDKEKSDKKETPLKSYHSIEEAAGALNKDLIKGIVILKDESQTGLISSYQKNNFGVVVISETTIN